MNLRFDKVLLVSPPAPSRYGGLRVPASIGYLAQALQDQSIDYEYVDMRIGYTYNYLMKTIHACKPSLIGISMITLGYKRTYQLISNIKNVIPSLKIVVGGHHMTILKDLVLKECQDIDFGVVGDGEDTLIELCNNDFPIENISGLIRRENGKITFSGLRPVENNLDRYSFPRFEKFNLSDYSRQIPVHSSRGCVGQCTFCPNKLIGRKFRKKSVNYFVDEIEYWYKKGYNQFAIDDDNFTLLENRVYQVCDEIERRNLNGLFIRCSNGIRADRINRKLLLRMKEIGVREIGIGVDGGNNKILGHLKKGETIEQIENAIQLGCELGLDVKIFIIVGTPHETEADIEDSIRLARKYPVARVNFNNAIPYPGTEMYDYSKEKNLFIVPPEEYLNSVTEEKMIPVIETPELSRSDRIRILKKCHKVENEVMKNTAYRMYKNFPIIRILIKYFFNVSLFEKIYFNNLKLRKFFDNIRYHKLIKQ